MPFLLFLETPWGQFIAAVALLSLARTTSAWYGAASGKADAGGIQSAVISILTAPLRAIGGLAHKIVSTTVSHWAAAHVKVVARWFLHLNVLTHGTYTTHADFAETTAHGFERMRAIVIPREIKSLTGPIGKNATTALKHANAALAREKALSASVATTHRAQVKMNVHYTHAIDLALPEQLGRIRSRSAAQEKSISGLRGDVRAIEDGAIDTFKWLRSHPLSAATGVFAGAVAIALTRMGFGFLRCRSWQRVGRSLTCGMGNVLADLLEGVIAVLIVADLCALTKLMIGLAESAPVQDALRVFIDGMDELLLCQGVSRPPALNGYAAALPPAQPFAVLAAAQ